MAVQPQTPYKEYTANGSTKSFALEFDCDNQDHLIVLVDDVEAIVGIWSLSNGAVVFNTAPEDGKKITVQRNTPFRRDGDFQSYDNSFRPGPVNKGFDWIWLKLQELGVADWILSTRINDLRAYVERQDNVLQDNIDSLKNYVDDKDDELRNYLLSAIQEQGVALDQLEEYYSYLMQQLAQVAIDRGWAASFIVSADGSTQQQVNDRIGNTWYAKPLGYELNSRVMLTNGDIVKSTIDGNVNDPNVDMTGWIKTNSASQIFDESGLSQQEVNNNLYQSINVFTNRTRGFVSLFEFIPNELHSKLKDFSTSKEQVGDVSVYIQQALDYAASNRVDVLAPFAFYFINNTVNVPPRVRFIGLSQPYILCLDTFTGDSILNTDREGQFEFYIDNFYLNGIYTKEIAGIHVGGCRNSTFKQIQATACLKASIYVHPTHPDSGDVENIELDHIWSVRSQGIVFETNSNISRGNVTDGTITNCQLTTGDVNVNDGFPIRLTASPDRCIFGLKFDRIFTKTTEETHILINPNGGVIYGNEFSFFTGEAWVMGSGAPSVLFAGRSLYVLDGSFLKNKFTNFYMTGLLGNGISLGNGSFDNTFDGLICSDLSPTYDNQWIEFRFGADRNICNNVNIDCGLKIEDGATGANNIFGKKIKNVGQSNIISGGKITTAPPTLVKRDHIFQNNGIQLTNYPVEGCGFTTVNGNLSVTVPAGTTPYYLDIPFNTTATFRGDRVAAMLNYQFNASANGLILVMHIGDNGKQIADYTVGKDGVMAFTAPLNKDRKKLVISFSGNRAADVTFIIKDIVIVQGNQIPYLYEYNKLYIEN